MTTLASEPRPQSSQHMADQYELGCSLYELHRKLRMNALYYGKKLVDLQRRNFWLEVAIAISTSATVGSLAIFKLAAFWWVMPSLAAIAAILGVVKPLLGYSDEIARLSKMWNGYISLSLETASMVDDARTHQEISQETESRFKLVRDKFEELSKRDDPYPDKDLLMAQKIAVDRELPASGFWSPPSAPVTA